MSALKVKAAVNTTVSTLKEVSNVHAMKDTWWTQTIPICAQVSMNIHFK